MRANSSAVQRSAPRRLLQPISAVLLLTTLLAGPALRAQSSARLNEEGDPRRSYSVRGSFLLPQNDLRLTTASFPQFSLGAHSEFLLRGVHQIRPTAEWWYFRQGHQFSNDGTRSQTLDTKLQALAFGAEYLYRPGGPSMRFSVGGGLYLMRWSVDSVNTVTFAPYGTATSSGTSTWLRLGDGFAATYRLTHKLELEGRWIHSHYGQEDIPENVALLGAGWRF